jgi:penicillin amidase
VRSGTSVVRAAAALLLATVASACSRGRTSSAPPLVAQVAGAIAVEGIGSPVKVVRDRWGVPHIYASSRDDLFFAQGFVQAQDRLFQMDLWRRAAQGRLSEVLGPNFIERDAMTRRIQYDGDLDAEWARYGPDARSIAGAFVRGVNAWAALARERPPEAFVLAGWRPESWSPDDLLNRTDAIVENATVLDDIARAGMGDVVADSIRRAGAPPFFTGLAAPLRPGAGSSQVDRELAGPAARIPTGKGYARTSGTVLEFADTPIGFANPSARYLVHLVGAGWNAIGVTSPWRPGVAAGHNGRVAWAFMPSGARTQTVRAVPDTSPVTATVKRTIVVKGRDEPFSFDTESTEEGIVIATDRAGHRRFVFSWIGFEPGAAPEMMALAVDRAASRGDVEAAVRAWKLPARSFAVIEGAPATAGGTRSERLNERGDAGERQSARALFAHALGITEAARRRFNIGPVPRPAADQPVRLSIDVRSWDESRAMNAPGQSEDPNSRHFADLVGGWSGGALFPLVYSDGAVQAQSETTLTLTPASPRTSP